MIVMGYKKTPDCESGVFLRLGLVFAIQVALLLS
jgi:hypothetical protein